MLTGRTDRSETVHQIVNHYNLTFIREPNGLPVKIRFDETSQFAECLANVSVATFLRAPQRFAETSENWKISLYQILSDKTDKSETTRHIMYH